jgi:fructose-bisphosphate aldolase class II
VEGEIGDIGTGSEIHEKAPDLSRGLTSPAEQNSLLSLQGWISWLRPWATCTGC